MTDIVTFGKVATYSGKKRIENITLDGRPVRELVIHQQEDKTWRAIGQVSGTKEGHYASAEFLYGPSGTLKETKQYITELLNNATQLHAFNLEGERQLAILEGRAAVVQEVTKQEVAAVVTRTAAQAERLIQFYNEAEKEIIASLNKALLKGGYTADLQVMLSEVKQIQAELMEGAHTWAGEAMMAAYLDGLGLGGVYIPGTAGMGQTGLVAPLGELHQAAIQVLADNTYQRLEDVNTLIGRRVDDIYRKLALENVRGSVANVKTLREVAKAYKEQLAEQGITGFVDAAGREWDLGTYAEMAAQTSASEAMREGSKNGILVDGGDLGKIIGGVRPAMGKSGGTCDACAKWDGVVVSLTGKTAGYPTYAEAEADGVFHPRCIHTVVTVPENYNKGEY